MKKNLLLFGMACMFLLSCEKKQSTPLPVSTEIAEDSTYIINGVTDIKVSRFGEKISEVSLLFKDGKQKKVTLTVEGLPKRMFASFDPAAGIPGFSTTLNIKSSYVAPGVYPIVVKGTSESGATKSYKVNVEVLDDFNCDTFLTYNLGRLKTSLLSGDSVFGSTWLFPYYNSAYYLSNVYLEPWLGNPYPTTAISSPGGPGTINLVFDCNNFTVKIPEVTTYGHTASGQQPYILSGSGSVDFERQTMEILYEVKTIAGTKLNYKLSSRLIY